MDLFKNIMTPAESNVLSRRKFLGKGLLTMAAALVPHKISAALKDFPPEKKLSFYNVYSHEHLDVVFWKDGKYIEDALFEINHIFRDSRTGKEKTINKELLDLLFSVQQKLQAKEPFHIVSGYRTPKSNELLSKRKKGVAKNSLHMYGKAVDIRIPGHSLKTVRKAAMSFGAGGVGYYPRSKFVHVDVGLVRYWWG